MAGALHYFAFGSNLHPRRLAMRVPSRQAIGTGALPGRRLAFHKRGRDGSAKADAFASGDAQDRVFGALYRIAATEKARLDAAEGLGRGYREVREVVAWRGRRLEVFFYEAEAAYIDPNLRAFDWYKALVLAGARHHRLPASYVRLIEALPAIADADAERTRRHLEIARLEGERRDL